MATSIKTDADDGNSSIRVPVIRLNPNPTRDEDSSPLPSKLIPKAEFESTYGPFQALHIRGFVPSPPIISTSNSSDERFQASDVQSLFKSLNSEDIASWCVENMANENEKAPKISSNDFLDVTNTDQRGYCSFLVQHSKTVMDKLLSCRLPVAHLPVAHKSESASEDEIMKVHYGPALWLFFGKNYCNDNASSGQMPKTLLGRQEHTDSVTQDGTWHYQLSGTKIWRLRPVTELMHKINKHKQEQIQQQPLSGTKRKIDGAEGSNSVTLCGACADDEVQRISICKKTGKQYIEVECKQGDILFLNTRLWWHSTLIPAQDVSCISYARDVYFPNSAAAVANAADTSESRNLEKVGDGQGSTSHNQLYQQQSSMANIDATYAAEDIEPSTILFTEHTMPECELHRSKTNANCEVVEMEDEESGESYMAVVSLRAIKAGEFFAILESDEEEESGSDEDIDDWDEEDS